jgi:outer membrane protein assembly factor BamE (lipoprotein component of BamABCDE complex)
MKKYVVACLLIIVTACVHRNKGFYFDNLSVVENFDAYNFTKDDVVNNIGQPSLELDDDVWLYYSYNHIISPFKKNKLGGEKILTVYFNENDEVINHYFVDREFKGDITDIKQEKKAIEGNILKEFFRGLMFSPIGAK